MLASVQDELEYGPGALREFGVESPLGVTDPEGTGEVVGSG